MIKDKNILIVYSDPSPTEWEIKVRALSNRRNFKKTNIITEEDLDAEVKKIKDDVEFEIDCVKKALKRGNNKISIIKISNDYLPLYKKVQRDKPDLVFNFFESADGNPLQEMYMASIFEILDLKYTGSSSFVLGLSVKKDFVKDILRTHKIPTPDYWFVGNPKQIPVIDQKYFPLIVKPHREDASIGIDNESIVFNKKQLVARIKYVISTFNQGALVEKFVNGREFNVSILGTSKLVVLPISEIDYATMPNNLHHIVSYEAKWAEGSEAFGKTIPRCPADIESKLERKIKEIAIAAYRIIGCRNYARIDIRLDKNNNPYILEVNPNPDISPDAGFPRSAKVYGLEYSDLINEIANISLEE